MKWFREKFGSKPPPIYVKRKWDELYGDWHYSPPGYKSSLEDLTKNVDGEYIEYVPYRLVKVERILNVIMEGVRTIL